MENAQQIMLQILSKQQQIDETTQKVNELSERLKNSKVSSAEHIYKTVMFYAMSDLNKAFGDNAFRSYKKLDALKI